MSVCKYWLTPPIIDTLLIPRGLANFWVSSSICWASSLVGARMMAYGPRSTSDWRIILGRLLIHTNSGITKAAVFPLPVDRDLSKKKDLWIICYTQQSQGHHNYISHRWEILLLYWAWLMWPPHTVAMSSRFQTYTSLLILSDQITYNLAAWSFCAC